MMKIEIYKPNPETGTYFPAEDYTSQIQLGSSVIKRLDRELDTGQFVIPFSYEEKPLPMFSIVDFIVNDNIVDSYLIADDHVQLISKSPNVYKHIITLIEHTKILEKFNIGGKTFTQPTPEAEGVYEPYTLYDVVKILRDITPFKTKFRAETGLGMVFDIPQETQEELEAVIAPEFVFKDVTLRQALDEVASVLDGIVRLERDPTSVLTRKLYIDKFNELQDKLDDIKRRKIEYNHDIEYYSTNMITDAINPVDSLEQRIIETYPAEKRFTTLRSEDFVYNPETSFIPTPKRIYGIDRVIIKYGVRIIVDNPEEGINNVDLWTSPTYRFFDFDVTNRIVERENRRTMIQNFDEEQLINPNNFFKNNTFEYTYGQKNIKVGETFGIFNIDLAWNNVLYTSLIEGLQKSQFEEIENEVQQLRNDFDYQELPDISDIEFLNEQREYIFNDGTIYKIELFAPDGLLESSIPFEKGQVLTNVQYTPMPKSVRFETQRDNIDDINFQSYTTANQKLRIVDLSSFTNNLKSRINRTGTVDYEFSARHKDWNEIYNVGDYTEDGFVITIKEIIMQKDHFIVIYKMNKDFNKVSEFIGLDQEIRQWEIGERDRTVERDEFYSEVCELELTNDDINGSYVSASRFTDEFAKLALETFNNTQSRDIISSFGIESDTTWFNYQETEFPFRAWVSTAKQSGGNTLSMSFELEDNVSVGDRLVEEGWLFFDSDEMQPTRYTDPFGRMEDITIKAGKHVIPNDYTGDGLNIGNDMPASSPLLPNHYFDGEFKLHKDNREIIKFNLMLHFLPKKNNDIIIGNKFVERNSAFIYNYFDNDGEDLSKQLYLIKFDDGRKFSKRNVGKIDITGGDFIFLIAATDIDIDNYRIRITNNNFKTAIEEGATWAIVDGEQNLLVGVNEPKTTILFNFKPRREGIIY